MSSILDALRKLEEEKAEQMGTPAAPRPIDPAAREPAPRRSRSRRPARGGQDYGRKLWMAVPVAIFALGIIWAATTRTLRSDSSANDQELVAAATTASVEPEQITDRVQNVPTLERIEADLRIAAEMPIRETRISTPAANLTAPIQSAAPTPPPVQLDPAPPAAIPEPARVAAIEPPVVVNSEPDIAVASVAPIQVQVSPVPMAAEPEPEVLSLEGTPVEPMPESIEIAPVEPELVAEEPKTYEEVIAPSRSPEPSERYRKAMAVSSALRDGRPLEEEPEPEVEVVDIRRYDIMTRTVRARFDIPELTINMLMQPNDRHPRPSALINYGSVYVGETIPGTKGRVHLIGVDIRGIAVEVDGERFYYPK